MLPCSRARRARHSCHVARSWSDTGWRTTTRLTAERPKLLLENSIIETVRTSKKPRVETGTVRQSFSHGRTKSVVVEKRGKRRLPGEAAEAPSAPEPVVAKA